MTEVNSESENESSGSSVTEEDLRVLGINTRRQRSRGGRQGGRAPAKKKLTAETWYWMPSSIHKTVKHGKAIIEACNFPPGLLSEEVSFLQIYHSSKRLEG